jgi:glycosyltransferase involved in cell wall biosynthesis
MRIFFYPPFKPLGHPNPSGDLVTATGLYDYLKDRGHQILEVNTLRARWIYWKPWNWPKILREQKRSYREVTRLRPDLWLTYHAYYKAPDLLGPAVCHRSKVPYAIFQGMYSSKRKRKLKTLPGYILNKKALCAAQKVFTNRKEDLVNLRRILPHQRVSYVAPGIRPNDFVFDEKSRTELRRLWGVGDGPTVLSAAMFRPDVKTQGLMWVIRACGELFRQGLRFTLVIAGDGKEKGNLQRFASRQLPGSVRFVGKIPRNDMSQFYSAGDIFAFPGFRETLGMVFLEAQSCGLPVVACATGGIPEVVQDGKTGLLVPMNTLGPFVGAMDRLLKDEELRRNMGKSARVYVRDRHDLEKNYRDMEKEMEILIQRTGSNGVKKVRGH